MSAIIKCIDAHVKKSKPDRGPIRRRGSLKDNRSCGRSRRFIVPALTSYSGLSPPKTSLRSFCGGESDRGIPWGFVPCCTGYSKRTKTLRTRVSEVVIFMLAKTIAASGDWLLHYRARLSLGSHYINRTLNAVRDGVLELQCTTVQVWNVLSFSTKRFRDSDKISISETRSRTRQLSWTVLSCQSILNSEKLAWLDFLLLILFIKTLTSFFYLRVMVAALFIPSRNSRQVKTKCLKRLPKGISSATT